MTQERWAEAIGVDVKSVYRYEAGETTPSDETVAAMTAVGNFPVLAYLHLSKKSKLASETLPTVETLSMAQAVLNLLCKMSEFSAVNGDLIRVAADGKISIDELPAWQNIRARLDGVITAAMQVKYAEVDHA